MKKVMTIIMTALLLWGCGQGVTSKDLQANDWQINAQEIYGESSTPVIVNLSFYEKTLDLNIDPNDLWQAYVKENPNDDDENIAKWIKNLEAERDTFKKEADRLAGKAKSFDNKVSSLKRYLQDNLEVAGVDKVKGELFTVSLQNNAMSLDIDTIEHIPNEFKRTPEPVVNKRELLRHIKDTGEVFEGVEVKRTRSVRIR